MAALPLDLPEKFYFDATFRWTGAAAPGGAAYGELTIRVARLPIVVSGRSHGDSLLHDGIYRQSGPVHEVPVDLCAADMAISVARRLLLGASAGAVLIAGAAGVRAAPQRNLEYEVKGAFLYNFLTFIDWPDRAFAHPSSPFRLCLLGRDPFGPAIDQLVRGESAPTASSSIG